MIILVWLPMSFVTLAKSLPSFGVSVVLLVKRQRAGTLKQS